MIPRWLPALIVMLIIFIFSSQPSDNIPNFDWADKIVKKGGHIIGYASLALMFWHAIEMQSTKWWLAWLLAVLFGISDEFHQSFVPGRHASPVDVILYDNVGALLGILVWNWYRRRRA